MFRRKENRKVPGLNTTSTADISFMLLILFLVASSMDLDKGISRQLPPVDKQQEQRPATAVDSRKVLRVAIDDKDSVSLDGKPASLDAIRPRAFQLIAANGRGHLILLQSDRKASYDTYLHVQNELVAAYNAVRNRQAHEHFGQPFKTCGREQQQQIAEDVPMRISEIYSVSASDIGKGGRQ